MYNDGSNKQKKFKSVENTHSKSGKLHLIVLLHVPLQNRQQKLFPWYGPTTISLDTEQSAHRNELNYDKQSI